MFIRLRRFIIFVLLLNGLVACHNFAPSSSFDPRADYSNLSTFTWLPEVGYERTGIIRSQPAIGESIRKSIEKTLVAKGYQQVKRDPDFYVVFHTALESNLTSYDLNRFYTSPYGPKNTYWQSWSDPFAVSREYKRGTLLIDIIRRDKLALVWRGTSDAGFFKASKDRFDPDLTERAVQASLDLFPSR